MSKLSRLEKSKLKEAYRLLANVKKSNDKDIDSIQDFIHNQFPVNCPNKDEEGTLTAARKHYEVENDAMIKCFEIMDELIEHFEC